MPTQYTKDELWKIFEALPLELKQAVFSEETADTIQETCQRNNIPEEQMGKIAGIVGDSLMGLLHPEDLAQAIINETGLPPDQAIGVARDINRLIMFPVKSYLYEFYKDITFVPSGKVVQGEMARPQTAPAQQKSTGASPAIQRQTLKPQAPDVYRETAE